MTRPQTVSAVLVALTALEEAAKRYGQTEANVLTGAESVTALNGADAMRLKARVQLLKAVLAYGRRHAEPEEKPR